MSEFAAAVLTVLTSASVSSALSVAILWLTRALISARLEAAIRSEYDYKLEAYKDELRSQTQIQLEQTKSMLQVAAAEHQARVTLLHGKAAETIEQLHSLLQELDESVSELLHPSPGEHKRERFLSSHRALAIYFRDRQIYLPEPTADRVAILHAELRALAQAADAQNREGASDDLQAWRLKARALLAQLRLEFRSQIGFSAYQVPVSVGTQDTSRV